ncbi:hypothetical protein BCh11DRAFT_01964 [Burkholderia sp. Ch1-1]|jgi:pimeloyl-ACP methyl ester carboxylesterase|uniref:Alpha/beta hydrolase n=1 Tax=Paraburkholderia dioscoreae TaxID=2604047 RepID=A0A5Q4ZIA1_9BURK|nr:MULTISPECIES: alpha/beta hydrolase [Paraburkholderia]EIF34166.1 hypothetical protein BCh11DRAFT_01964 [Burkholderia sp. Ch1-1]MDR8395983.1 alpha/beta hydrolase [Paraburkholderia sp. USG1]VVD33083.1 conserved protein of unknown function [Paraburkholderia dioscoreae]
MSITQRNHLQISGSGKRTTVLVHGFGCDQSMRRYLAPSFHGECRMVRVDHVGHCPHLISPRASAAAMSAFPGPVSP